MQVGPESVLVTMSLDFDDALSAGEVEATVSNLERRLKDMHKEITRLLIEAQSLGHAPR